MSITMAPLFFDCCSLSPNTAYPWFAIVIQMLFYVAHSKATACTACRGHEEKEIEILRNILVIPNQLTAHPTKSFPLVSWPFKTESFICPQTQCGNHIARLILRGLLRSKFTTHKSHLLCQRRRTPSKLYTRHGMAVEWRGRPRWSGELPPSRV